MNIVLFLIASLILVIWIKRSYRTVPSVDGFDVDILFKNANKAIKKFAAKHQNETFYGFAIDGTLLCLNSVEKFEETLAEYRIESPERYSDAKNIYQLKWNTGDWEYMSFADFMYTAGFDYSLYDDHYYTAMHLFSKAMDEPDFDASDPLAKPKGVDETPYGKAMNELLDRLIEADAFSVLQTTNDFLATRVEHSY